MRYAVVASICAVLVAGPALASDVVLYGPGSPSPESAAHAEAVFKVAAGAQDGPAGGTASVLDLPFPSQDPIWMAGGLLPLPCADQTLAQVDPEVVLRETISHIDELDYEKALLSVDQGIRALPCSAHPVTKATLVDMHFFQGLTEHMMGNTAKARRAFSAALAVDIETPWKKQYPPAPQAVFLDAKSELLSRGTAHLGIDVRGEDLKSLSVDGVEIGAAAPSELLLYRGRHLVRYVDARDGVHAALVDVAQEGGVLVTRLALREAVLGLAWGGVATSAGKLALGELARNRGATTAWVVTGGQGASRAFSFDAAAGTVTEVPVDAAAVAALLDEGKGRGGKGGHGGAGATGDGPGRLGLVLGGGFSMTGADPFGAVSLRLHVQIAGGLDIGLGVQSAFRPFDADTTNVQPLVMLDVRWRLPDGPFHVYFGGRGLLGVSHSQLVQEDDTVYAFGGGAGLVGFDLTPAGQKGFVVNLDAMVGGTSRADADGGQLVVGVGAGVGFRL